MTPVTMTVVIATPMTLPEFRTRFKKPDTTPYLDVSTAESIDLLFGGPNIPMPPPWITRASITKAKVDSWFSLDIRNSPTPASVSPPTLNLVPPIDRKGVHPTVP